MLGVLPRQLGCQRLGIHGARQLIALKGHAQLESDLDSRRADLSGGIGAQPRGKVGIVRAEACCGGEVARSCRGRGEPRLRGV